MKGIKKNVRYFTIYFNIIGILVLGTIATIVVIIAIYTIYLFVKQILEEEQKKVGGG